VNGAINSAAQKGVIRGVDDGVYVESGDIAHYYYDFALTSVVISHSCDVDAYGQKGFL
jgi:hypothetical protein